MRDIRTLDPAPLRCKEPVIAQYLTVLDDTRRRTKNCIAGFADDVLSWRPSAEQSSIADLLYHIALVEADWLCDDVLGIEYPAHIRQLFPESMRDDQGRLMHHGTETLQGLVARLDVVRGELLAAFTPMELTEFRRIRIFPKYEVTPEWVLHHLAQHEAEHRGQIRVLRSRFPSP